MNNCFIILAAGKSNRFKSKTPKPFVQYNGDILIKHSINKAILSKKFSKIVVAVNKNHEKYLKNLKLNKVLFVKGGKTRADSARNCLNYLKKHKPKNIFIHDAARPNFSLNLIDKLLKALKFNDGAIPVIQSIDTPKLKTPPKPRIESQPVKPVAPKAAPKITKTVESKKTTTKPKTGIDAALDGLE